MNRVAPVMMGEDEASEGEQCVAGKGRLTTTNTTFFLVLLWMDYGMF